MARYYYLALTITTLVIIWRLRPKMIRQTIYVDGQPIASALIRKTWPQFSQMI